MIRTVLTALAGASTFLSPPLTPLDTPSGEDLDPTDVVSVLWPEDTNHDFRKLRSAALFEPGSSDLLVLANDELFLVRDPMMAPAIIGIAREVNDFAVLPPVNGVSRIVTVGRAGLQQSVVTDNLLNPSIEFQAVAGSSSWVDYELVDAARDNTGVVRVVGSRLKSVLHAKYDSAGLSAVSSVAITENIIGLAAADASSAAGVEFAIVTTSGVQCYEQAGTRYRTIPSAFPIDNLLRIPKGGDASDSFGFIVHYPTYDTFHEIVGPVVSDPLYGAQFRVGSVAFAPLGIADTRADMLFSCTNEPLVIALHGQPQGQPHEFPFNWDFNQWSLLGVTTNDMPYPPTSPILGCGDFDADGDNDLAMAGQCFDGEFYVVFKRGIGRELEVTNILKGQGNQVLELTGSPLVNVGFTAVVPQPAAFGALPTGRVRVRVFLRHYGVAYTETSIPSEFIAQEFFYVTGQTFGGPYNVPVSFTNLDVSEFGSDESLLYFEIVPQLHDPVTLATTQRSSATIWVGSAESGLLDLLICAEEPDEFSALYQCTQGVPLINEVHRRKVIRPITTTPTQP